ncbi:hypothetical protein GON03_02930 [Nocardioides sp. MAH-18]|uniref:Uncharacterized protein n=1 Tax=Nocardioides agri TaxID=2682843 RepID=A0A6L6XM08_9ACTN|nr:MULTISPECIES: hypothetical protein [unclassified Nocardioides]MBA2953252.1 hypothetical protein [Nocardioides sp. CGMCC 1.13656]MVQ48120.1 hypothetical protein [Nocardioides sp. MAH-18]
MTTVSYNARERRVVIDDDGWPVDADRVASAITACGEPDHLLVVDLTYLPSVPAAISDAVDAACRELQAGGCPVRVWTAAPVSA